MGTRKEGLLLGRPVIFQEDRDGKSRVESGVWIAPVGTQISGQVTGTLVNTFIPGPDVYCPDGFFLGGHPNNTSFVSYGLSGTLGMPIGAGDLLLVPVDNLNQVFLSVATSGDKITWAMV